MTTDDLATLSNYTRIMLQIAPTARNEFPRLFIRGVPATAWIQRKLPPHRGTDWMLWFERQGRQAHGKCPLRLEIESRLRSWLLREFKMPLSTLSYEELRLIAEGKGSEARRIHAHGLDILMPPRRETSPIPHISAA